MSKDGKSTSRLLVMLRLVEAGNGTLQPLLVLRAAGMSSDGAPGVGNKLLDKQDSDTEGEEEQGGAGGNRPGSPDLHDRLDSRWGGGGPGGGVGGRGTAGMTPLLPQACTCA